MMENVLNDTPINLAKLHRDKGGKDTTYDNTANSFGIAWEGTVRNAKLYMPSYSQN
ncbi:hypothetical protein L915_14407 [Phytophthora nicotianae]|uniref:Uncharacterized protein n=1 Tax=Phytophthora nicotianae TaxID=4792 RepID=W2GC16_PHYNI|nr:hypothetical protein L915_14407 [Phytophthora nicotianae]